MQKPLLLFLDQWTIFVILCVNSMSPSLQQALSLKINNFGHTYIKMEPGQYSW
jgi:hypothetical protein